MYSFENPIAGATTAYRGRNSIVKTNEPGIAATVYFVHKLNTGCGSSVAVRSDKEGKSEE